MESATKTATMPAVDPAHMVMANEARHRPAGVIAPLIGEAMRRINNEASVSSLFD